MVRTKMFDNIMKVIRADVTTLENVTQSVEVDLELPRGYIAKIKKCLIEHDYILSSSTTNIFNAAIIRDPDDDETVAIPENEVQHDVIMDHRIALSVGDVTTGDVLSGSPRKMIEFDQELDVVSARNLRFNARANSATPTIGRVWCEVYYTLEEVSDDLILNLLDIL